MSPDVPSSYTTPLARGLGRAENIRWPLRPSGDLFRLRYGKALTESTRRPGSIPVHGSNGQTGAHDTALFEGPGVVIGRKGMGHLGVNWVTSNYWVIDTAYSLDPLGDTDLRFAYYLISHVGVDHLKHGTSNPSLTREAFAAQLFPAPPLYEQRAIAEVLGSFDDKIAANQGAIGAAEQLMVALAGTSPLSTSVASWAVHVKASASPTAFDPMVAHFSLPAFDTNRVPEVADRESIKSSKFVLSRPVVLVSKLNPRIPRIWNVSTLPDIMAVASTEFVALAPVDVVTSEIWAALSQPGIMADLASNVAGTSGSHQRVKPAEIMALSVPDPRHLSAVVRAQVSSLGELTHSYRMECLRLEATRDELLPLLMSGQVQVREAEKVVEGVL